MYQNSGKGSEKVNEPANDGKKDESGKAKDKEPSHVPLLTYKPPVPYPKDLLNPKMKDDSRNS